MTPEQAARYRARVVLEDGTVLLKDLYARSPLACLRDFYHLLLDEMGEAFALFPDFDDWLGQTAAEHGLEGGAPPERVLRALLDAGTLRRD
ncbi:MAG: hypothetical protein PW734_05990 [Verrucomicrobium sp.]|nr:hypothetical protein [Verrucomicrobium sp.]